MALSRSVCRGFSISQTKITNAYSYIDIRIGSLPSVKNYLRYFPKKSQIHAKTILYFNFEMTKIVLNTKTPSLAMGRLDYWNDTISNIYKNNTVDEPVAICLSEAIKAFRLPRQPFGALIEERKKEVETPQPNTFEAFINRCEHSEMSNYLLLLGCVNSQINPDTDPEALKVLLLAARARGIVEQLKLVRLYLPQRKINLPLDVCDKHNLKVKTLWDRRYGAPKDELNDVVLEIANVARRYFIEASKNSSAIKGLALAPLMNLTETEYFLQELEKEDFNLFSNGLLSPSKFYLPLRMWRCWTKKTFAYKW